MKIPTKLTEITKLSDTSLRYALESVKVAGDGENATASVTDARFLMQSTWKSDVNLEDTLVKKKIGMKSLN